MKHQQRKEIVEIASFSGFISNPKRAATKRGYYRNEVRMNSVKSGFKHWSQWAANKVSKPVEIDVSDMVTEEIEALIFGDVGVNDAVSMPLHIATQVANMPHLSRSLHDWAWQTLALDLDHYYDVFST